MQRQPRRQSKEVSPGTSLALMLVDGRKIRQRIKREYEKLLRDLDKARQEADRFEKENLPGFTRWVNRQFGALLTEIRETTRRLAELESLVMDVETEVLARGVSPGSAYARVIQRRKDPKSSSEESAEADADEDPEGGGGEEETQSSRRRTDPDEADPKFDEFFGSSQRTKAGPTAHNLSAPQLARLKKLYRALARRLHPDAQKEMTPQKREWWHQAQAAYEKGDVEQLEMILSLCEIQQTGATDKTSLSALQRVTAALKKSLRQIKGQIRDYRRDPAWDFDPQGDNAIRASLMRQQLNHTLGSMKAELAGLEAQVSAWTAQALGRRAPRPRRRPVADPFEFFF